MPGPKMRVQKSVFCDDWVWPHVKIGSGPRVKSKTRFFVHAFLVRALGTSCDRGVRHIDILLVRLCLGPQARVDGVNGPWFEGLGFRIRQTGSLGKGTTFGGVCVRAVVGWAQLMPL